MHFLLKNERTINRIIQCSRLPGEIAKMIEIDHLDLDEVLNGNNCKNLDMMAGVIQRILEER